MKAILVSVLMVALTSRNLFSREIRTPLPLPDFRPETLYRCNPKQRFWYSERLNTDTAIAPNPIFSSWIYGYSRWADKARNQQGTQGSLAELLFCVPEFYLSDTLPGGTCANPLESFLLVPHFTYTDHGCILGAQLRKELAPRWFGGSRVRLPLRKIHTQSTLEIHDFALARENIREINGNRVLTYAYRLDFLATIPVGVSPEASDVLMTNFANNNFPPIVARPPTIANLNITDYQCLDRINQNPVYVVKRNDCSAPPEPFGKPLQAVHALPGLSCDGKAADGKPLANNDDARFLSGVNYLPLGNDSAAQSTLWVEPSIDVEAGQLVPSAQNIQIAVDSVIARLQEQLIARLSACGLSFQGQQTQGVGDFEMQFFMQHRPVDTLLCELFVQGYFPTSPSVSGTDFFFLPLGNNGHPGVGFGGYLRWDITDWMSFNGTSTYSLFFRRSELVPATFAGAFVKQGGPGAFTTIAWESYLANANVMFQKTHKRHDFSALVRYEFYYKLHDALRFNKAMLADCQGIIRALDSVRARQCTDVRSHKLGLELCYTYYATQAYFTLFGGYDSVVAGKQVPLEHTGYFGFMLSF